jgi:hypothetical protein
MAREIEKRRVAEQIWLHYFNQELYRQSLISATDYSKMILKIERWNLPAKEGLHTKFVQC